MRGEEEATGPSGREPSAQHLGRATFRGLTENRLQPAPDVPQLGCATPQQRKDGPSAERGAEEVRDSVNALREDVRPNTRLIVQQGSLIGIGGGASMRGPK